MLGLQVAPTLHALRGIVRAAGQQVGIGQNRRQRTELRHRQHHLAFAADLLQPVIDHTLGVGSGRHLNVRARAELVQRQRRGRLVGPHYPALHGAQHLALGIGRQPPSLADADRHVTRRQQVRNPPVIDMLHDHHHIRCLHPQRPQQRRQQPRLDVIGQTDAEGHLAGLRIEIVGQAEGD
ncbi:hypothetical protein D9M71_668350 [compost metagenome]